MGFSSGTVLGGSMDSPPPESAFCKARARALWPGRKSAFGPPSPPLPGLTSIWGKPSESSDTTRSSFLFAPFGKGMSFTEAAAFAEAAAVLRAPFCKGLAGPFDKRVSSSSSSKLTWFSTSMRRPYSRPVSLLTAFPNLGSLASRRIWLRSTTILSCRSWTHTAPTKRVLLREGFASNKPVKPLFRGCAWISAFLQRLSNPSTRGKQCIRPFQS